MHCKNNVHSEARDSYVLDLLTAVIEASHEALPSYGGCWVGSRRQGLSIPGQGFPFRFYGGGGHVPPQWGGTHGGGQRLDGGGFMRDSRQDYTIPK